MILQCVFYVIMSVCLCFQCSVSCGQGTTTRQVVCMNISDQVVETSECDLDDKPTAEQECAMPQCPSRSSDHGSFSPNPDIRKKTAFPGRTDRNRAGRLQAQQWRTGPWGAVSTLENDIKLIMSLGVHGIQCSSNIISNLRNFMASQVMMSSVHELSKSSSTISSSW